MNKQQHKILKHNLRKGRVRSRVSGTESRPRLSVFRSNTQIYAQIIDDVTGKTLAATSSINLKATGKKVDQAVNVGKDIAAKATAAGIKAVVFDRGGYKYHGRVKALADAAREAGLQF
ncbi:50S ribosomal protein L18 [bacterium]|nr:MAG: 50S ribosomal protein L18 [bacterium]